MKPILFSTPMVQAILAGRKTMTRRVIKGALKKAEFTGWCMSSTYKPDIGKAIFSYGDGTAEYLNSKYQIGDDLWVRETWQYGANVSTKQPFVYKASPEQEDTEGYASRCFGLTNKWRPSIFMPKEAARIFLRVTDVRVERLQDITEEDAKREGIPEQEIIKAWNSIFKHKGGFVEKIAENLIRLFGTDSHIVYVFRNLWNDINLKRGHGWDTNPWVWVISFERCENPEAIK